MLLEDTFCNAALYFFDLLLAALWGAVLSLKNELHAQERGAKFDTCSRGREINIQTLLEMTNNSHSGPQGHFFTDQVRQFLSKLVQRARGWARQEKAWQHQTLDSLLQESESHFFKLNYQTRSFLTQVKYLYLNIQQTSWTKGAHGRKSEEIQK